LQTYKYSDKLSISAHLTNPCYKQAITLPFVLTQNRPFVPATPISSHLQNPHQLYKLSAFTGLFWV